MFSNLKEFVISNKKEIITKVWIGIGTAAGFALVKGLITMGLPCEDCEVDEDDLENEDHDDDLETVDED